jgi:hypothetical protein
LHDLSGLTVAALRDLLGDPRELQRMLALGMQSFDGRDLPADRIADRNRARADRRAVEVNSAGAALADATPELRPGESEPLADDPQQRRVGRDIRRVGPPVDGECNRGSFSISAGWAEV